MIVHLYIEGAQVDLFKDEKIEINLSVKKLTDISAILSDFTQSFSIPASPHNNFIFQNWYDQSVDGGFNANIRVDAYLEVNTLPFRYGSVQLENAKYKDGQVSSYNIVFYSNAINLSDKFSDDKLSNLDFTPFNHNYDSSVMNSVNSPTIAGGDIYYPLINAVSDMSIGNTGATDLINPANTISYRQFKPALRLIRIIEAIESKYSVTFSRDFFGRACFHNLFMWLAIDADVIKAFGDPNPPTVDFTLDGLHNEFMFDAANNTITYDSTDPVSALSDINIRVTPEAGFETVPYKIQSFNGVNKVYEREGAGVFSLSHYLRQPYPTVSFKVVSAESFSFQTRILCRTFIGGTGYVIHETLYTSIQSLTAVVNVSQQMPELKVKDFVTCLMSMFNLVIRPTSKTDFYIDTLDSFYDAGKAYDITKLIDIKDITAKCPNVKKKIEFLYQKAGAILGLKYFEANATGYGDLKTPEFSNVGDDLKIQLPLENMMFERLANETSAELTNIQVGYSITKDLKPYKIKPIIFYRNGFADITTGLKIQPAMTFNRVWHTATEDNINIAQVTSCLNWGSDLSTYFYAPIIRSLYYNFWETYIADLFNPKTRVLSFKCVLPISVLYDLGMNDRFIISDRKYKISNIKVDLTTSKADVELFTDYSYPADSVSNVIPLTVDRTDITADSTLYTADMVSVHLPVTSYITNGIDNLDYIATASQEHFDIKVSANTNWTATKISTGSGTNWFSVSQSTGAKSKYVMVTVNANNAAYRSGKIRFTIGTENFDLLITQTI